MSVVRCGTCPFRVVVHTRCVLWYVPDTQCGMSSLCVIRFPLPVSCNDKFPIRVIVCAHFVLVYVSIGRRGMCSLSVGVCSRCAWVMCSFSVYDRCPFPVACSDSCPLRILVCSLLRVVIYSRFPLRNVLVTRCPLRVVYLTVALRVYVRCTLWYVPVARLGICPFPVMAFARSPLWYVPVARCGTCPLAVEIRSRCAL